MSDNSSTAWNGYSMAIDMWEKSYNAWKKSGEDAMKFYLDGCNLAVKSADMKQVEKYNELWQKTLEKLSFNPLTWTADSWSKMMETGFDAEAITKYWQAMWKNFENKESPLSPDEIMDQFNDSKSGENSRMSEKKSK